MKMTTCAMTTCAPGPAVGISAGRTAISRISILGISALCVSMAAIGISVSAFPERALAQADGTALDMPFDMTWPVTDTSGMAGPLPAADIVAEVRREGFYPVSRPVHRGRVYVLFAVDQDDMDVKLTVDAASGRILWVASAVAHLGGPGHYRAHHWRSEHLPPEDIVPGARTEGARHTSMKRFPPLLRTRPGDLAGTPAQDEPPAHGHHHDGSGRPLNE
jgi:hypothetical protein